MNYEPGYWRFSIQKYIPECNREGQSEIENLRVAIAIAKKPHEIYIGLFGIVKPIHIFGQAKEWFWLGPWRPPADDRKER